MIFASFNSLLYCENDLYRINKIPFLFNYSIETPRTNAYCHNCVGFVPNWLKNQHFALIDSRPGKQDLIDLKTVLS